MTAPEVELEQEDETPPSYLEVLRSLGVIKLFTEVPLDQLKVDHRYQRTPSRNRVLRIVKRFDDRLVGVLTCAAREDGVYVIDGQHRLLALRELNKTSTICEVRSDLTIEDEAYLFYNLDTARAALSSDDAFRALLAAEDPTAKAVKETAEKIGFVVLKGHKPGGLRAYKTLMAIADRYGIDRVTAILKVLYDAWGNRTNPAPQGVLEGMNMFLNRYPEIDLRELSRSLATTTPEHVVIEARNTAATLAWNTMQATARVILNTYNHNRSINRLEDRF